jgi:PKD repeat protein
MKKTNLAMLIIPFLFLVASTSVFATNEIIVDNTSSNFSKTGTWTVSTGIPRYYGTNYLYTAGGSGENTAQWSFQLPSAGVYQVFAWWPGFTESRSPDAPYTISHMGGSTTVRVSQRINGGQWNDLGIYQFAEGQTHVMLTNAASNYPVADAVRMVYFGDLDYVVANFTAAPLIGIAPLSAYFTDTSLGAIQTWSWEFGDGEISAEQNPTHVYQNPGTYTVTLTVTGGGQQSTKTRTNYIMVNPNTGTYATQFRWPVDEQDFFSFQAFGNVRSNSPGYHAATDFAVYRFDVPAHCIANGWVEKINPDSYSDGMGYGIMIKHRLPDETIVYSWYNHMSEPVTGFSIGQFIPMGTILGTVGETGWTPSGLHMHLEIKKNNDSYGGYVGDLSNHYNPYEFIYARLGGIPPSQNQCSDGTFINDCSTTRPLHCIEGGYLVLNSLLCGCDTGVVQADSTCTKT